MIKNRSGYSLLELVIVIVVVSIAGTTVAVNLPAMFISLNIEQVAASITTTLARARQEALKGNPNTRSYEINKSDPLSRTFYPKDALQGNHSGITITDHSPESKTGCEGRCSSGEQMVCISGKPFCYRGGTSFTYERFSGELKEGRAIFLVSASRKFAVFVSPDGKSEIAELVNGEWQSRTEIQKLQPIDKQR